MENMKPIKVALICGGKSAEREVSLAGAQEVEKALDGSKYQVTRYDPATELDKIVKDASQIDVAFILLHGKYGEDGTVQGLLDLLEIPYQCSGVLGCAIAMDKHITKVLYRQAAIPTPDWIELSRDEIIVPSTLVKLLGLPLMIKPCTQGSSVGMAKVTEESGLEQAINNALKWDDRVIVEAFVKGRELTGGVLELDTLTPLPIVEIIPDNRHDFFDYDAKYTPGETKEICPAEIPNYLSERAQEIAKAAHRALQLKGYSRTDMILSDDGEIYVIETNTIPGMTPTSLLPQAAQAAGISFASLLDKLIERALKK